MSKITIPDALKNDVPQSVWGKILTATPVVMTVVATALAGLSSSEMTRAQYGRSLAAQQQSKAGDQWGFFQAKRLRAASQRNTLDLLQATTDVHPFSAPSLDAQTTAALQTGTLPALPSPATVDADVAAAASAIESSKSEDEIMPLVTRVKGKALDEAMRFAKDRIQALDEILKPINKAIESLEKELLQHSSGSASNRDLIAARLRYTAARYDAEARLNQVLAYLYELQVRISNHDADRHHSRSQKFFYGMLIAQAAVIISTFSLAAQKRSFLWSLAAAGGAAAVGFAVYVYLFV